MASAAWLQLLPVILLLGAEPFPLSLFDAGPATVSAADRSKWHIPMPSVSITVATESREVGSETTAVQAVHECSEMSTSRGWDSGTVCVQTD